MFLGIANAISGLKSGGLSYIKDNLKLYLDFKSSRSDTLAFPSEGSTSFDGTNDEIKIADSSELQLSTLTISAWVKPNGASEDGYIFTKFDDSTSGGYALGILGSTNKIRLLSSGVSISQSDAVFVDDNVWVHVAVTVDGSGNLVYYRNGVSAGTASSVTLNTNSVGAVIGNRTGGSNTGHYFNGKMANVAIWSRALSTEEVQSVMNKNYSQLGSVEKTSLVSWWALDTETLSDNLATGWTSGDTETLTTDGANITSAVNSSGSANIYIQPQMIVRYRAYKVSYDYTLVSGDHPYFFTATNGLQDNNISTNSTMASLGSSWYFTAGTGTGLSFWKNSNFSIAVDNFSIKAVISADSHGSNTGYYSGATASNTSSHNSATTTTSVYGNNSPVLPRAIDIAESFADAIGNGSALFERANNDYIDCGNILNSSWCSSSDFTIAVWVYPITNTVNGGIVGIRGSSGTTLQLYLQNGFKFKSYNETGASGETSALTTNVWTHVAMVQDGSNKKFYFNGILDTTTSQNPSNAGASESFTIGFTGNPSSNENFDGRLSQLGAWAGALTQSQVQSLMESTSYAKIPADVKSTLGSNTFVSLDNFETKSGGQVSVANNEITLTIPTGGDSGMQIGNLAGFGISSSLGYADNDLAKISFEAKVVTNASGFGNTARFKDNQGNVITNTDITLTTEYQTFTNYYVLTTVSGYRIPLLYRNGNRTGEDVQKFRNFSVQKVTNDLVAYYPLDADSSDTSSVAKITNDSVNGETLSAEKLGAWANSDLPWTTWTSSGTTVSSAISNGSATMIAVNPFSSVSGSLYKITFNLTLNSGTVPGFTIREGATGTVGDGSSAFGTVSSGLNTHYFEASSTKTLYMFFSVSSVASNFSLSDVSIKEVTSNTGVLK